MRASLCFFLSIAALASPIALTSCRGPATEDSSPALNRLAELRSMSPILTYEHRVNIVYVLEEGDDIEKGLYVFPRHSSYWPVSGDDGFTLTHLDGEFYEFERTK